MASPLRSPSVRKTSLGSLCLSASCLCLCLGGPGAGPLTSQLPAPTTWGCGGPTQPRVPGWQGLPIPTTDDGREYGHAFVLLLRNGFVQDEPSETGERADSS